MIGFFEVMQLRIVRKQALLSILSLVVWLAAVNHCFLEHFLSKGSLVAAGDVTSQSDSSGDKCPLHSERDPDSHEDGKPCGGVALTKSWGKLDITDAELLPVVSLPNQIPSIAPARLTHTSILPGADLHFNLSTRPFDSLSVASNAPPASLI